ncbi:MAG: DUF1553 domain-containing protein [Acidobacteriota bacterium]|nr:DUF1553 domain-containing protein [Acidobacteriota bacterium]
MSNRNITMDTNREDPETGIFVGSRSGQWKRVVYLTLLGFVAILLGKTLDAREQTASPEDDAIFFTTQIRPILKTHCLGCHGGGSEKSSGLDLSTRDRLLRGGDRGPDVVPGNSNASLLYKLVSHGEKPHMPLGGEKLSKEAVANIAKWIDSGVFYDKPLVAEALPEKPVRSDHWSFQPPVRPPVPRVDRQDWVLNPIDAFIAVGHEKLGLKPLPPADKRVLVRRIYMDLIGLLPTREEVESFLADSSADAYETVVDRLLASPHYGERWGRHWMDVWRYSDWYGWRKTNDVRYSRRHIWRWRDWIIESLNDDKSYDRMIVEMLAGDEIAPTDSETVRATGFLARNWRRNRHVWLQDTVDHTAAAFLGVTLNCARCHDHKYDPISQEDYYRFWAFFEPHGVRTDRVSGEPDLGRDGLPRAFESDPGAPTYLLIRGDETNPDKANVLSPDIPEVFGDLKFDIQPVHLPLDAYYPDIRDYVHRDLIAQAKTKIEKAERDLLKAGQELGAASARARMSLLEDGRTSFTTPSGADESESGEASAEEGEDDTAALTVPQAQAALELAEKMLAHARAYLTAMEARIAADRAKFRNAPDQRAEALALAAMEAEQEANLAAAEENLLQARQQLAEARSSKESGSQDARKDAKKKVQEVRKQLQAALDALKDRSDYSPIGEVYPKTSTGRRLALARWIASRENPLTARVAVNHIWLRHFGSALVPSVTDFGANGEPPSHPELLDWLAVELMESGWSMKSMHRLILTSNTYRMQSWTDEENHLSRAADSENRYLWRMNPRRMEAEVVRDSILLVAGHLDTKMGGPEIDIGERNTSRRRSIYFQHAPDAQLEFLKLFDAADPGDCYRRKESITPHQSLAMANSQVSFDQARLLARRLTSAGDGNPLSAEHFVKAGFETVLGRPPSALELAKTEDFLQRQAELLRRPEELTPLWAEAADEPKAILPAPEPHLRARENLIHVLFNHNEFITIR